MLTSLRILRQAGVTALILSVLVPGAMAQGYAGTFTQHNDLARTGQNLHETTLTTTNVRSTTFGKLFTLPVDNQVYAQPLYVPSVAIPGQGTHNVLYVVTEGDSVFALDADGLSQTPLWSVNFTNPANGVNIISCILSGLQCNVYPNTGITATPVIDPVAGIMYVLERTANTTSGVTTYAQTLHALSITTGADIVTPVTIAGSVKGTGSGSAHGVVTFNALHENNRPGIVLANNTIYLAWAGSAHGWIMAYNATTLAQIAVFCTTPNGSLGGVWAAGNGLAVDSNGNIYAATGDGPFDVNTGGSDYGDSVIQFSPTLEVLQYFTPSDQACRAPITTDLDLGSGGPMILPTQGGTFPDELIQTGKGGSPCDLFNGSYAAPIYVVNRDSMGGYNANQDADIQTVAGAAHGYWSDPAFWQGPSSAYLYFSGEASEGNGGGDYLRQYTLTNGVVSTASVEQTTNLFTMGSTPSISANGTQNGIVWAMERKDIDSSAPGLTPAVLYAYLGTNVAKTLYTSSQTKVGGAIRDQMGCGNKFQTPTIANGKVYVGTQNEIDVFGLLANKPVAPLPTVTVPCFSFSGETVGTTSPAQTTTLTNLGPGALTISGISFQGINPSEFSQTNTCGSSVAQGASCKISITFTPSIATIPQQAYLQVSDNQVGGALTLEVTGVGSK